MRRERAGRALALAACASYLASCTLGALAATRVLDTRPVRWAHHALYIATFAVTGAAASGVAWADRRAAAPLIGSLAPLALIPAASARTAAHPTIAALAAPFYAASAAQTFRR